ncbi:CocE/NonD family hydrolase [Olivibacter ginsenosidimutans]|uniref:CocE/NonD family hydrolase n=1 Tax=Olivibacter ginsenosidimutans TaxID=1176537 RepID=A0ABP9CBJ0_9SPHI
MTKYLIGLFLLLTFTSGFAQYTTADSLYIQQHYKKMEVRIPMRDGKRLFTSIYLPLDSSKTYPIMFMRTPYSVAPYGRGLKVPLGPSMQFAQEGFIFVYQDIRGKYLSEGTFMAVRPYIPHKRKSDEVDESSDAYDTIDWLIKNLNNNGKVGVWGISAPGGYATATLIDSHPAVVAVSPQAPVTDWFMGDDRHHNGAFMLMGSFAFVSSYGKYRNEPSVVGPLGFNNYGTPDAYQFYLKAGGLKEIDGKLTADNNPLWQDLMTHGTYDTFWKARTPLPHLRKVKPAVLTVGGWFDQEDLYGPLKTYTAIAKQSRKTQNMLVMGPWYHGSWTRGKGDWLDSLSFALPTSKFYREQIEFPFFMHYLKGKPDPQLPKAFIFDTGEKQWHRYSSWPPPEAKSMNLYLQPQEGLSFLPPPASDQGFVSYISDPAKPVPYSNKITLFRGREYMIEDQRFAARRPDVLVFATDILKEDVQVMGNLKANLFISSTGTDADFIVKLIDVFPDTMSNAKEKPGTLLGGYQLMVRGEVMRAKFRHSFENPKPLVPGKVEKVTFDMQDAAHTFKKGHRMMVQIQSSWFPLVDRNPQQFMDIYQADASAFKSAVQRVYFSREYPSHIVLPILTTSNEKDEP